MTNQIENIPHCSQGGAYITINGQNRKIFELSKISAQVELNVWEKQLLGDVMQQSRATGGKGTGSMSVYHMTSDFLDMLSDYKKNRIFPMITIQGYHDDPASEVGRLEIVLSKVVLKKIPFLAIEEGNTETAPIDIDFNFSDYAVLDKFKKPASY